VCVEEERGVTRALPGFSEASRTRNSPGSPSSNMATKIVLTFFRETPTRYQTGRVAGADRIRVSAPATSTAADMLVRGLAG